MVLQTHGDGKNHDGSKRTIIVPTIDHSAKLSILLDDFRILGIASGILGDDFNYGSGDGNYYSGDTGWHPDGVYPELVCHQISFLPRSSDTRYRLFTCSPRESSTRFFMESVRS